MSGHNKWSQIKTQKAKTDAYKSKVFGKYAKLIGEEARKANGNLSAPGLKGAIEKARAENMPSDNIERAIKKATGAGAVAMESITYEAYGPSGVAIIIHALTGNRNKAAQEVKFILSEHGANLAAIGSASWAFRKKQTTDNSQQTTELEATTTVPLSEEDLVKLEALVDALESNEEVQEVYTNAE